MTDHVAVLKNYPLRLWLRQQEHYDTLMREFQLLVLSANDGDSHAPQELLTLASYITGAHGKVVDEITEKRHAALARGLDRMDSYVPLIDGLPELLDQVDTVMQSVDDYCRNAQLLLLPRTPDLIAFADWTSTELRRQYAGDAPSPWPGLFEPPARQ